MVIGRSGGRSKFRYYWDGKDGCCGGGERGGQRGEDGCEVSGRLPEVLNDGISWKNHTHLGKGRFDEQGRRV